MIAALLLLAPPMGHTPDARATLEFVARSMGADGVKTLEYTGTGVNVILSLADLHHAIGRTP